MLFSAATNKYVMAVFRTILAFLNASYRDVGVSCPRFLWTPICLKGDRDDEDHEISHDIRCYDRRQLALDPLRGHWDPRRRHTAPISWVGRPA